ncbi:MAG TPA: GAF domain-containing protein, partial [Candidatus Sulfotelmatobacter sp.]|nr:GAF domain-containing protein [Candidatus Sulfotelmatobacter sp.]
MDFLLDDLLASLTAIGRSLQETFDPRRFLGEFSTHVQRLVPHDRLVIAYLEEAGDVSIFAEHAVHGPLLHRDRYTTEFDPGGRYPVQETVLHPVFAGQPMLVRDLHGDPRFSSQDGQPSWPFSVGVRSRIAAPLESRGRIIGALLAGHLSNDYTESHLAAARRVADLIAPFIENIVLLHRERRRRTRLAALGGLACVFGASLNIEERLDQLAEPIRRVLDFDVMGMTLAGASGRDLELVGTVDE